MMGLEIYTLSKSYLIDHQKEFLFLDKEIKQEEWTIDNFLYELPEKWHLSRIAVNNQSLIGFLIASKKKDSVHVHRLAIGFNYQSKGVGAMLVEQLWGEAKLQKLPLTLKVHNLNIRAIKFYEGLNFKITAQSGTNLLMCKKAD